MIVADESSYFDTSQIQEARETVERYWAKSDPTIVLCSTPARPMDPMDQIKAEPEDKCIYKRMFLSYKLDWAKYTYRELLLQKSMSKGMKRYWQRRKKEEEKSK
ncbi:MAG: hypothetical protein GEU26_09525 [Nitrososphaeraceae archaeon]|nr:hypothetical protein [Nitrososphaeraceae archaeon]